MFDPRYNDTIFFGIIFSFLVGVAIRSFTSVSVFIYITLSLIAIAIPLIFKTQRKPSLCFSLCIFVVLISFVRFDLKELNQSRFVADELIEQKVNLSAKIISAPEYHSSHQRFIAKVDNEKQYKVLVSADRYPELYYGDTVTISGTLKKPENFITDTGREFDYIQYLAKDDIYYTVSFARVYLEGSQKKKGLKSILFSLKDSFLTAIHRIIPEPESALLGGILLGVKESLGDELEQDFIKTGTIHIVVLSGYNVTIVSEAIVRNLKLIFPQQFALSFGAFGIVLFALITGATTTTIRASIMGLLGLLARVTGRTYDIFRALCLAAFFMVLYNPYTLIFDVSFQLSFIATLGLILISPIIEKTRLTQKLPQKFAIREIFASTIATQIAVLPYLVYRIGTLSLISPLANMVVLPLIPLAMGVGALAGFFELVLHLGSNPLSWLSFGFLHYVVRVVGFLASFSWSAITVPVFHSFLVIVFYGCIIVWVYRFYNKKYKITVPIEKI